MPLPGLELILHRSGVECFKGGIKKKKKRKKGASWTEDVENMQNFSIPRLVRVVVLPLLSVAPAQCCPCSVLPVLSVAPAQC